MSGNFIRNKFEENRHRSPSNRWSFPDGTNIKSSTNLWIHTSLGSRPSRLSAFRNSSLLMTPLPSVSNSMNSALICSGLGSPDIRSGEKLSGDQNTTYIRTVVFSARAAEKCRGLGSQLSERHERTCCFIISRRVHCLSGILLWLHLFWTEDTHDSYGLRHILWRLQM